MNVTLVMWLIIDSSCVCVIPFWDVSHPANLVSKMLKAIGYWNRPQFFSKYTMHFKSIIKWFPNSHWSSFHYIWRVTLIPKHFKDMKFYFYSNWLHITFKKSINCIIRTDVGHNYVQLHHKYTHFSRRFEKFTDCQLCSIQKIMWRCFVLKQEGNC